ncbi:MAG TPA: ATP-binding protein [Aigarchaeota archaeon]|nr:ATP-binding protein [Aigarchaeota archaeon]
MSRMNSIEASGFVNEERNPTDLKSILHNSGEWRLVIVDLLNLIPATRRLIVEYLLTKLSSLLKNNMINPIFLFAEEAHLYLRETYWEDIVTRMRHLGLFPVFITNQPDTIPEAVYRQADNIFLFNFSNENDLERISKAARIDAESVKMLGKTLPPRYCLLIGRMVSDIPVMLKVRSSELKTMGYTRIFFRNDTKRQGETYWRNSEAIH